MAGVIWTIGHSTRPIEEFMTCLQAHGIQLLVDVRIIPYSRRNPQFNADTLPKSLSQVGIHYQAIARLGGRRKRRPDSINLGWRNAGFQGYADYMQTTDFWAGIESMLQPADQLPTAIMCAESVPWRCHRSLIADALVSKDWTVRHIFTPNKAEAHILTAFACVEHGMVTYPQSSANGTLSRLL